MNNIRLLPPLRLVLNTRCNGNCYFCHHEGNTGQNIDMSWDVINECLEAACELNVSRISLTGGEPTLRNDLSDIILTIKKHLPATQLGITTNGFALCNLPATTLDLLDNINLSMVSFEDATCKKYQDVDIEKAFVFLKDFADKTTINIVVVEENKDELIPIIKKCFAYGFGVDLMFELYRNDVPLQKKILSDLTNEFGLFSIHYGSTPIMIQYENSHKRLRVKAPSISKILQRDICRNCPQYNQCTEKICALRIQPDGCVSPCLNGYLQSNQKTVAARIKELYPKLDIHANTIYDFFFNE